MKMKGCRKILIAVDGSMETLKQALKLTSDEKSWVTVLKVLPSYEGDLNLTGIKNIADVLNSNGSQVVSEIKKVARDETAFVKVRLEEGDISQRITEVAEEERCDLIIMGASKRKGLSRFFGGDVWRKVIEIAHCPVLVTKT
jgi:nucleotide-binding universal stress UspA family protein